jgi:cell wall-associated NlpC family hydrolase
LHKVRKFVLFCLLAALLGQSPLLAEDARAAAPGPLTHIVVEGEEPESLARLYGVSIQKLRQENPSASWSVGAGVVIPAPEQPWPRHTVKPGETLWRIGKGYGISVEQLRQANGLSQSTLMPGQELILPRALRPDWSEPPSATPALPPARDERVLQPPASEDSAPQPGLRPAELAGTWVEVRLPDNRRAWAPVSQLVVGSWQPQPPDQVVALGREFLGVPYRWGGVDPNGWDCSGFVQEIFRLAGHQVPRLADDQYNACRKVAEQDALRPGDLVFFNTSGSGVSHVGIYCGDRRFLHASSSRGVVEDSLDDSYFTSRYLGAGRLPAWEGPEVVAEDSQPAVTSEE